MKYINYIFVVLIITLATSELKIMDLPINRPISWLLLAILSIVLITTLKNRYKKIIELLVLLMIISRILSIGLPDFYLLYDTINSLLFFVAGLLVFSVRERVFSKQLLFFTCICVPIMFLQLAGVPWVFYHTQAWEGVLNGELQKTVFQTRQFSLMFEQYRPPGILWSNQPMGLLITFSMAYFLFHKRQFNWIHYLLFGFIVLFSTSYYVYFSYLIILSAILLIKKRKINKPRLKILTGTLVAVLLFFVIFPGVNAILWDKFDIMNKVWVRLIDLRMAGIDIYKIPYVNDMELILLRERLPQLKYISKWANSSEYITYSMIGTLYKNWFILIIVIAFSFFFIIKVIKTLKTYNDPLIYSKIFTLIVLVIFIAINPQFDWSLYVFLLAFPLTIIFPNFLNKYTLLKNDNKCLI